MIIIIIISLGCVIIFLSLNVSFTYSCQMLYFYSIFYYGKHSAPQFSKVLPKKKRLLLLYQEIRYFPFEQTLANMQRLNFSQMCATVLKVLM